MSLVVTPVLIETVDVEKPGLEPRRFRPRLSFGFHQDLQALIRDLHGLTAEESIQRIRACIDTAEAGRAHLRHLGVHSDDLQPTIVYLASLPVLRDLVLQGWTPGSDDDGIYILPPALTATGDDPGEAKSDLRNSFRFALADQLHSPSVAAFVSRMEQQGIAAVFADGVDLAARSARPALRARPRRRCSWSIASSGLSHPMGPALRWREMAASSAWLCHPGRDGSGPIDLPVWSQGEVVAHYRLTPGVHWPTKDELRVALSLGVQAGAAIASVGAGPPPPAPARLRLLPPGPKP